jgi:hypothetical protein
MRISTGVLTLGAVIAATLFTGIGWTQIPELTTPPSTTGMGEPPRVEQPPARPRPGGPPRIACWACSSDTGSYRGYYVGGGSVCCGQPRTIAAGTWGWDYHGCLIPQRVLLRWSQRYQGGVGAYRSEGPHLLHPRTHERADP